MKLTKKRNFYLIIPILLLINLFLLINCKTDDISSNSNTHIHDDKNTNHLNISELPTIENILNNSSRNSNSTLQNLNLNDIIEYVNSDGKKTYTFEIIDNTSINFENLHLIKLPNDIGYASYVMKWEPNLQWYQNNDYQMSLHTFTGNLLRLDLDYNLLQTIEFNNGEIINVTNNQTRSMQANCEVTSYCQCIDPDNYCGCSYSTCFRVIEINCNGGGGSTSGNTGNTDGTPTTEGNGVTGNHLGGGYGGSSTVFIPDGNGNIKPKYPTAEENYKTIIRSAFLSLDTTNLDIVNNWLDDANTSFIEIKRMADFLTSNQNSQQVGINIINILSNNNLTQEEQLNNIINELDNFYPLLEPNLDQDEYATEVLRIANWIKVHGEQELGEYIESIVPDFPDMTHGDVYDIYILTRNAQSRIQAQIILAVLSVIADTAYPFIEFAVIDATLGAALPLLAKIPVSAVVRGARLNKMLRNISKIGNQGSSEFIREIPNSSVDKAWSLFTKISQNRIGTYQTITTPNGNILRANMGNNNFITYRTFATQSPNTLATVELNFANLFDDVIKLKFNN